MSAQSFCRTVRLISLLLLPPALTLPCVAQTQAVPTPMSAPQPSQQGYSISIVPVPGQGAPLITVWINESQSATLVVDTGANNCLVSQSMVKKLGLTPFPALHSDRTPILWEDGKQAQAVTFSSLVLGGQEGPLDIKPQNIPFLITKDEQLRVSADRMADGWIGVNLLNNLALFFDFPNRKMILVDPGGLTSRQAKFLDCNEVGGAVLPLSRNGRGLYTVPVGLSNSGVSHQADLMVDTGSQTTEIPRDAARDLSLTPLRQLPQAGLAGNFTVNEARIHELTLGNVRLTDPLVTYTVGDDRFPRIGMDILSGYKMLLDFPAKKMYLQPAVPAVNIGPTPSAPTPANKLRLKQKDSRPPNPQ